MIEILLAGALTSRADLPKPASDTIQVLVSADGEGKVPAQGYQVTAFLAVPGDPIPPGKSVDIVALKARLARLEMPSQDVCMPSYPIGFVGNEAFADEENDVSPPTDDSPAGDDVTTTVQTVSELQSYLGLFKTKSAATQAVELLRMQGQGRVNPNMTAVLFDCTQAMKQAELDALAKAQQQVQPIAEALDRHVLGVTSIEFGQSQTTFALASMMAAFGSRKVRDDVDVPINAKVQFLLGK